ncbi:hypothetical protein BYT27DRAFT_7024336, partial [Phlegmacium glaucopus]
TADIRTIFKRDKEYVNPETGATEDGHWCTLCHNAGHVKIYTERCKKLGIVTNERVYAKSDSLESIGPTKQGTLDSIVTRQPRPPAFTTKGLLDYIVEFVVSEDEVISTVN